MKVRIQEADLPVLRSDILKGYSILSEDRGELGKIWQLTTGYWTHSQAMIPKCDRKHRFIRWNEWHTREDAARDLVQRKGRKSP